MSGYSDFMPTISGVTDCAGCQQWFFIYLRGPLLTTALLTRIPTCPPPPLWGRRCGKASLHVSGFRILAYTRVHFPEECTDSGWRFVYTFTGSFTSRNVTAVPGYVLAACTACGGVPVRIIYISIYFSLVRRRRTI